MRLLHFLVLPTVALALAGAGKKPPKATATPKKSLPDKKTSAIKHASVPAPMSSKVAAHSSSRVMSSSVRSSSSSKVIQVTTSSARTSGTSSTSSARSSITKSASSSSMTYFSSLSSAWSASTQSASSVSSSLASSSSSSANAAATTICIVYPKTATDSAAIKRVDSTLSSLAAANAQATPTPSPKKSVPNKAANSKRATAAKPVASSSPTSKAETIVPGDKNGLFKSDSGKYGFNFWRVGITTTQIAELKKNKDISYVAPAGCGQKGCFDPSAETGYQENAGNEMSYLSWGNPGRPLSDYQNKYFYDTSAGKDATIYLIDSGANLNHPEFTTKIKKDKMSIGGGKSAAQRARWLYTGMITQRWSTEDMRPHQLDYSPGDNGPKWHGTCMLSRMVGFRYGVAKRANTVIVKVPFIGTPEEYLQGVAMVLADVAANGGGHKKILNLSWYYYIDSVGVHPAWVTALYNNLRAIHDLGVTILAGSGNEGRNVVDGYPAVFASDQMGAGRLQNMIVVGAINANTFERWLKRPGVSGSNIDVRWPHNTLPHVYAPGTKDSTMCAEGMIGVPASHQYRGTEGTSPATAAVSGLAAYLAALHDWDSAQIKNAILTGAWVRNPTAQLGAGIKTVWNGMTDDQLSSGSCVIMKRSFGGLGPRQETNGTCMSAPEKKHARDLPSAVW